MVSAQIIDGEAVAAEIRSMVNIAVSKRREIGKNPPGLATVLVGDNPASHRYVRLKQKACADAGIVAVDCTLPAATSQQTIEAEVLRFNADTKVHGILVQLPLPTKFNEQHILDLISPMKDVDGFHPENIGRLAMKGRQPLFTPCTPAGCLVLLEKAGVEFSGANAVVLGRSNIVGIPMALLLLSRNCTVTICHSRTADILVAAIGQPEMVKGDWIKPGAIVIDVGFSAIPDPSKKSGQRIAGDVDFDEAKEVAGAITPVPGGVGPMTIAMLLKNTLAAAELGERFPVP